MIIHLPDRTISTSSGMCRQGGVAVLSRAITRSQKGNLFEFSRMPSELIKFDLGVVHLYEPSPISGRRNPTHAFVRHAANIILKI